MHYLKWSFLVLALLAPPAFAEPVDINTADAATLANAISGVGERKAALIVEYRETHGPFASVDELAGVTGIGAATINKNRDNLTVANPGD